MNFLIKFLVTYLIVITVSFAEEIKVFDFTETELSSLEVRKVRGADNKTIYTVGSNENGNFLKAIANNAASGLGKEIKIDLPLMVVSRIIKFVNKIKGSYITDLVKF